MTLHEHQTAARAASRRIEEAKKAAHAAFVAANRPALVRAFSRWTRDPEAALATFRSAGMFFGELGGPLCAAWESALDAAEAATADAAAEAAFHCRAIAALQGLGDGSGFSDADGDAWSKH